MSACGCVEYIAAQKAEAEGFKADARAELQRGDWAGKFLASVWCDEARWLRDVWIPGLRESHRRCGNNARGQAPRACVDCGQEG